MSNSDNPYGQPPSDEGQPSSYPQQGGQQQGGQHENGQQGGYDQGQGGNYDQQPQQGGYDQGQGGNYGQQPTQGRYGDQGNYGQPPQQGGYDQGQGNFGQGQGGYDQQGGQMQGGYGQQGGQMQGGYGQAPQMESGYAPAPTQGTLSSWGTRVGGYAIDIIAPVIAFYIVLAIGAAIGGTLGGLLVLLGYLALLGFQIWNRWLMGGKTGQSIGRKQMGVKLISEETGQPIGPGMAFVRDIAHALDSIACFVGWFFPLWDAKRQTFADKVLKTVVIDVPK
ncbi:RDD family protein [Dermatophilaceae bacterium Sec6.4]